MSYIAAALAPQERLIARARFHWISWAGAIAALVFLGVLIVGVVMFARSALFMLTTEIGVTDRRLILKIGLINRRTHELMLTSIEAVQITQGVFGRLLGFGRIHVSGTGDEDWRTPMIADPVGFRRAIAEAQGLAPP